MAIQLYRTGETHEVRGVTCEIKNFQASELETMLEQGWVKDPSELIDGEDTQEGESTVNPVRLAAKEAGIDGWDTKRIKTLESELDD